MRSFQGALPDPTTRALVPVITFALVISITCADALLIRESGLAPRRAVASEKELAGRTPELRTALPLALLAIDRPPLVTVRISRVGPGQRIDFGADGPYRIVTPQAEGGEPKSRLLATGEQLEMARAEARAGQVLINSIPLSSERVTVHPRRNGAVQLKGTEYRGSLLFEADAQGRLTASNQVDLEEYVNGVLLSEMPLRFGREALRAQAVIARSFALFQLQNGKLLRDDQGSQVYTGLRNVTETVRRLVRSTVGEVLTYEGSLLEAYFHSTCGGVTSSARGVFNIPEQRPLQGGVVCRDCRTSPHYRWTREIPSRRLSELYAGAFGDGLGFEVAERLPSGRAKTIAILDRTGAHKDRLTADRFRNNFNSGQPLRQQLPSMLIQSIERQGGSWRVQGNGFGHGVGLCQYGAGGMAGRGAGYREILERYYPEVTVRRLYE